MKASLVAAVAAAAAIPACGVDLRYRRDMNAARARQAVVNRHVVSTQWGAVYAERGHGDPVLEAISVRTPIAHTKDDQLASHDASKRAAERIPGARFFAEQRDRRAERVAS